MVRRNRKVSDNLDLRGWARVEHWRKGSLLSVKQGPNLVVNVGKLKILDVMFQSSSQIATGSWYMGLIINTSYTGIDATDTMGSHAGWLESSGYDEATRPLWGQGAAASQVTTNASPVVFSMNTGATIKGVFITSQNTKGGSTGTLWSAMLFPTGDTIVVNGDELRATYSIGA